MNDLTSLEEPLAEFEAIKLEKLKRSNLGETYSFEGVFPQLEAAYQQLKLISSNKEILENSPYVSNSNIGQLVSGITNFNNIAKKILEFDLAAGDPNPRKEGLVHEINGLRNNFASSLQLLALVIRSEEVDPKQHLSNLQEKAAEAHLLIEALNKKNKEADITLQSIKDVSAISGTTTYSSVFKGQAKKHSNAVTHWILVSVGLFIVIGFYLGRLLWFENALADAATPAFVIRESVLRVLILGALFFALSQSIKNYNANKHLQVINEHRQNSLDIFEAFVNAAPNEEVKAAVLLQATKSIFETGQTGHLSKEGNTNYSLSIADMFKRLGS